jgi:putative ABC transport system permease protein
MKLLPFDYAVRNLGRSPTRLALSLFGAGLVVLLAIVAGAFVRGMDKSLTDASRPQNVMLISAGSEESVERSNVSPAVADVARAGIPGIRQRLGRAYVSPEIHAQTNILPDADAPEEAGRQVLVRGVEPEAFLVHTRARLVEGRLPQPGADEIIIGTLVGRRLGLSEDRLAPGNRLRFYDRDWTITGRLDAPGSVMASEIWTPVNDLLVATQREELSVVVITLDDTGEFADADTFTRQRLDLELSAVRETDYYASLSGFFAPIRAMVWATALLIASGGILGGLNTMYAAFASRVREVGTLQALGYSRRAVVVSLTQESVLAAAAGTLAACVVAVVFIDGVTVAFSSGVFGLRVDQAVLSIGIAAGLALGLLGALPPAVRCLRLPIAVALKDG